MKEWNCQRDPLSAASCRKISLDLVSRARLAKIERYKKRMGWRVPWHSSFSCDFNYDFHAAFRTRND